MILSIGMIVKNEAKYLDECLSALTLILENLDSELIIIDTGSVDNTVEIAKKYTNKIYHFEWSNDFSAARNETLKHATGEWYMFIDADEILQDTSELINFFKSRDYTKYDGAKYIIKSYKNAAYTSYTQIYSYRLYKLNKDTRFKGAIHEYIPIPQNIKTLCNTIFDHYGYVFGDTKFIKAKAKRNIDLLVKEVELEPNNPRLRSQLADSYLFIEDYDNAIMHAKIGIDICVKTKLNNYYFALQPTLILSYIKSCDYLSVLEESTNYLNYIKSSLTTNIDIYYFMAMAYYELKNYNKCIEAFNKYTHLLCQYNNKKLITPDFDIHPLIASDDLSFNNISLMALSSCIQIKDFKNSYRILQYPSLKKLDIINNTPAFFNIQLEIMKNTNDYSGLYDLYINTTSKVKINHLSTLEQVIENFTNQFEDEKLKIIEDINNWDIETDYVKYTKIKYSFLRNNSSLMKLLDDFFKDDLEINANYSEILYYIITCNLPISLLYKKINADNLSSIVNLVNINFDDFISRMLSYTYIPTNIEDNYLLSLIYENALQIINKDNKENIINLYNNYLFNLEKYLIFTYSPNIINDKNLQYVNMLPSNILAGFYCILAEKSIKNNDKSNYIKYLKLALNTNEKLNDVIAILLECFSEDNFIEKPKSEFEILAETIKNNIKSLINNGDFKQAIEIFNEYKLINPNDKDIEVIEKLL